MLTPFSYAGRQSQRLRAGGLEEGGEGCEQSKETLKEESKQSSPRNKHIHWGGKGICNKACSILSCFCIYLIVYLVTHTSWHVINLIFQHAFFFDALAYCLICKPAMPSSVLLPILHLMSCDTATSREIINKYILRTVWMFVVYILIIQYGNLLQVSHFFRVSWL